MSEEIYRQRILDHYRHPRNFGKISGATHAYGQANASCGDQLQFQVRVVKNKIKQIGFTGSGCAISMASASLLADHLAGRPLNAIKKISLRLMRQLLQIPISPARENCALLAALTLNKLEKIKS